MILHQYSPGFDHVLVHRGHGFGSVFARLFSKIATKTASKAALSAAKRAGSSLIKASVKKAIPLAKKTVTRAVRKGVKKAVPIAKKLARKGVKRAAEEAQTFIANKVRKVEKAAIKKGVPPKVAHKVSTFLESGSRQGVDRLSKIVDRTTVDSIGKLANEVNKTVGLNSNGVELHRARKVVKKRKQKTVPSFDNIQNLIDTA